MSNCELGNLQIPSTSISFFRDPDLTQNFTDPGWPQANPVYIGVSAIVRGYGVDPSPLFNDPEIALPIHGGLAFILGCEMTAYDLTYVWYNGSVQEATLDLSNWTTNAIFTAPYLFTFGQTSIDNAASVASANNNTAALAETWSTLFSQSAIALSAGVMSPRKNPSGADEKLVSRCPGTKSPFVHSLRAGPSLRRRRNLSSSPSLLLEATTDEERPRSVKRSWLGRCLF